MTKKKDQNLAQPVVPSKWEEIRSRERITPKDYRDMPARNSTMHAPYHGTELLYRGMRQCS